jgi:hypothetical protein
MGDKIEIWKKGKENIDSWDVKIEREKIERFILE